MRSAGCGARKGIIGAVGVELSGRCVWHALMQLVAVSWRLVTLHAAPVRLHPPCPPTRHASVPLERPRPCAQALSEVLPSVASKKKAKGGYLVLRPDSGDPTEAVLMVGRGRGRRACGALAVRWWLVGGDWGSIGVLD